MFLFLSFLLLGIDDDDGDIDPDNSPDFYVNICQPLNPIPGVTCPPGAAICMDPYDGPPVVSSLTNVVLYIIFKKRFNCFDLPYQGSDIT